MSFNRSLFLNFENISESNIGMGNCSYAKACELGLVIITSLVSGRHINFNLHNVLFVPDLTNNHLLAGAVNASDRLVVLDGKTCRFEKDNSVMAKGQIHNGPYCLDTISAGSFD